jgi:NAD(P)-dependent dehydrogenase (short-subunit alcohol dehydrogenase family)
VLFTNEKWDIGSGDARPLSKKWASAEGRTLYLVCPTKVYFPCARDPNGDRMSVPLNQLRASHWNPMSNIASAIDATIPSTNGDGEPHSHGRLAGKVVVITGAANGIGRTMAQAFSAEGARIAIADVDVDRARDAAREITASGGDAHSITADITQPEQVQRMIEATVNRYDRLDVLVNNAGIGLNRPFLETTLEEWRRMIDVVLTGTFVCSQAAARVMVSRGAGVIVNVASISGQRGAQGRAAYGAAKAGVIQLTRVMAVELAPFGVRVNAISPGPVATDQSNGTHTLATRQSYLDRIPLHRYGERHEVAAAALFLASDESSFVHGHILNVDGGFASAGLMFDPDAE